MKFTIRDLFWLTLLVACCVMWWQDRIRLSRLEDANAIEAAHAIALARFYVQVNSSPTPNSPVGRAGEAD